MLQYTMLRRAQTRQRVRSKGHATGVAGSRPVGTRHRITARHPWGSSSGAERESQESDGTYFAGILAAGLTFHQETRHESPYLMVDAEWARRYAYEAYEAK
jgi:hypothetical protein